LITASEADGRACLAGVPLACPADRQPLALAGRALRCPGGHEYPLVGDVAVLLRQDTPDTHPYFEESRRAGQNARGGETPAAAGTGADEVDPFVQQEIVKTNGILYQGVLGGLRRYPIPDIPLPDTSSGLRLLDIGCNWGRWSIAASRRGYRAIGIDPGIAGVQAAYRVSRALGQTPEFVVGDGRSLPFPDGTFDVVFSYSVLQHFSKEDARESIREAARVTRPGGRVLIQLANLLGVRQLYNQARDVVRREQNPFRVRRWTPGEMLSTFRELVGPSRLTADGFFSLNAQASDLDLLRPFPRAVVRASQFLKGVSAKAAPLSLLADSVFIEASRAG
jgi:SAM-dependent methyltransferase